MNSTRSSTSSPVRFVTSRAQLSPLGRRTGTRSMTAQGRGATTLSAPRTVDFRATPTATVNPTLTAGDSFALPSFWTSGALDRLQPEVTRYHE
jgi:hypothetical protein